MKTSHLFAALSLFFLVACGPGPEPESLPGESSVSGIVHQFMRALEAGDFEKAQEFLYHHTDYLLKDLEHCRELFFTFRPSGMRTMEIGHENYGGEWHIMLDLKVNYGDKMKMLRFTFVEGNPPKLRALNPIIPE